LVEFSHQSCAGAAGLNLREGSEQQERRGQRVVSWVAAGHGWGMPGSAGFVPCACPTPAAAELSCPFVTQREASVTAVLALQSGEQTSSSPSPRWQLQALPGLMAYDRSDASEGFHLHHVAVSSRWNHKINI